MNRNTLFSSVRSEVNLKRSRFDLSKRNMTTFSQGALVPIYCNTDILAGDTFDISTRLKIRSRTPLAPVMDNARLDTYWFFTPYRNVWDGTKAFYGDSDPSAWISPTEMFIPALTLDSLGGALATVSKTAGFSDKLLGSLWDHFGLPLISYNGNHSSEIPIDALAFRAYKLIWNEWFRDENLQDAQFVNTSDTATLADYYPVDENGNYIPLLPACRLHDFFSSCLPGPQKGNPVYVPLVGLAPIITGANNKAANGYDLDAPPIKLVSDDASINTSGDAYFISYTGSNGHLTADGMKQDYPDSSTMVQPANLWADLSSVDLVSVNALRLAVASQRILERYARGGSRFHEFLRSFFGTVSPDAAIQIPQYLGGQTALIVNNQVIQTGAPQVGDPLGQTGAYSLTVDAKKSFVKSFTEPGILMCLAVVRVQHSYEQRIDRQWTRQSIYDFYLEPLSHLGEQQVKNHEIFYSEWDGTGDDPNMEGFGYMEAWNHYRFGINEVTGEMRPSAGNPGMRPWQYTDHYSQTPKLSPGWIAEPSSNVNQTLAVDSSLADQFFGDFFFDIKASRVVSLDSRPGLVDHY